MLALGVFVACDYQRWIALEPLPLLTPLLIEVDPVLTLAVALEKAREALAAGRAVRLRLAPGFYREEIVFEKPGDAELIIEASEPGTAIVCGSDPWGGWERDPAREGVWRSRWSHRWGWFKNPWPVYMPMPHPGFRWELVFMDKQALHQVTQPDELRPGAYCVDEDAGWLYLHPADAAAAPSAERVEVSMRPAQGKHLLHFKHSRQVTVRGLVFRHARHPLESGALMFDRSSHILVEDCRFEWNNSSGLEFEHATDVVVRRTRCDHNGTIGMGAHGIDRVTLEDVQACGNNWRGSRWGTTTWFTSGIKFLDVNDLVARRVRTDQNHAIGFWLDNEIARSSVEELVCCDNLEEGVHFEAADGPIALRRSVVCRNGKTGVAGRDCDGVVIEDCLVANNGGAQIEVKGELPREDPKEGELFVGRGKTRDQHRRYPRDWVIRGCTVGSLYPNPHFMISAQIKGINQTPEKEDALYERFIRTLVSERNTFFAPGAAGAFQGRRQARLDLAGWRALTLQDARSRWDEAALRAEFEKRGQPTTAPAGVAQDKETNA